MYIFLKLYIIPTCTRLFNENKKIMITPTCHAFGCFWRAVPLLQHTRATASLLCELIMVVVVFFKKRFPFSLTDSCLFSVRPWAFLHIAEEEPLPLLMRFLPVIPLIKVFRPYLEPPSC